MRAVITQEREREMHSAICMCRGCAPSTKGCMRKMLFCLFCIRRRMRTKDGRNQNRSSGQFAHAWEQNQIPFLAARMHIYHARTQHVRRSPDYCMQFDEMQLSIRSLYEYASRRRLNCTHARPDALHPSSFYCPMRILSKHSWLVHFGARFFLPENIYAYIQVG
jgi:hypothetical protein